MKSKLLILLTFMSFMGSAYACRSVMIQTPQGVMICWICNDGQYINCLPS